MEFFEHGPEKFVVMEYVQGEGLGHQAPTGKQLELLRDRLHVLYALKPDGADIGPVHCNAAQMLGRARAFYEGVNGGRFSGVLQEAYTEAIARLASKEALHLSEEPAKRVFMRGDPNLANCLWDGERLYLIDFEYAGWSDKAYDLADLTEHPQSLGTDRKSWDAFMETFALSEAERRRYSASCKLLSLFWLGKLWLSGSAPFGDAESRAKFEMRYSRFRQLAGEA